MKPSQLERALTKAVKAKKPVLITGGPGIGKTTIVKKVAKAVDHDLVIFHPVVEDPTNIKGQPWVINQDGMPCATFLPYDDVRKLIEAKRPTIALFDDLGHAPAAVQASYMQVFLGGRIGQHTVSEFVTFVACTNRKEDKAGVTGILEPVKSRFRIWSLEADMDDLVKYAIQEGWKPELIAFMRFRPSIIADWKPTMELKNTVCPRTLEDLNDMLTWGLDADIETECYAGSIGEAVAVEWMAFLKMFRQLPNVDLIITNPDSAEVPKEPSVLFAVCGALVARATEKTFEAIVKWSARIPAEFSVMLVKDCMTKVPALLQTKTMVQWILKHQDVII